MSISVEDAFKDEGFQGLPNSEKVKALLALPDFQRQAFAAKRDLIGKADPTFAKLSTVEQNRALNSLGLGTPLKNAISKAARPVLEMGGMMVGETIGGAAGVAAGSVGGIPGAVLGGGGGAFLGGTIGYAGGHEASNAFDTFLGMRKPITSASEAATSTAKSLEEGAMLASGGKLVGKALEVGIPALSQGAAELAQRAGAQGFKLTPAQLMKSKPLALLEGILAKVPLTAGRMKKFTGEQSAAIEGATQKLMDTLGSVESKDEMGKIIQKGIESKNYARLKVRDRLFDRLTKVVEDNPGGRETFNAIKLTNTGKKAQELLSNENQLLPGLQDEGLRKFLFNLSDNNAAMTFQGAKLQRERLNALIGPVADTPEKQAYKKLKIALDQDISDFASLVGGKVEKAFVKANAFHGAVKQLAEDPNIQKLVNANPAAVVDAAFKKNTGATEMMLLRKALPENVYQKFQSAVVNKLFEGPATNAGIEGIGSHAQNLIKNLKRYGEEPIAAALPAGSVSRLKEFADIISKINPNADIAAGNASGTGSSIFTWVMAGGQGHFIINAVKNPSLATTTAAGAALLTPPIMAKIYMSDIGRKLITEGFRLNPASAEAAAVGAKVLALARMEYLRGTSGPRVAPIDMKPKKGPSEAEQNISRRGQFIDAIFTPAVPSAAASVGPVVAPRVNVPQSVSPDMEIYKQALTAYLDNDFSKARSLANKALKANPKRVEARRLIERLDFSKK